MSLKSLKTAAALLFLTVPGLLRGQTVAQFDTSGLADMQSISDYLNSQFTKSMGFYSTLGWDNPPTVFDLISGPHFEFGIGGGVDLIQVTSLNNLNLQALQGTANVSIPSQLPAPYPVGTLRVGLAHGLDVGLKVRYLPQITLSSLGFAANYTGVGADFRYKIMEGRTLPTVTVGVSFDELQGNLGFGTDVNQNTTYYGSSASVSGTTKYALNWNVHSFGAKLLVGKDLMVIYPFAAVGFQRNSGTVVSNITGQLTTTVAGNPGAINANVTSNGTPVLFEPKYVLGLDFGEGFHWSIVGESNGSDLSFSTSFRGQF